MFDQNIGKHCSISICKQKDWLPVKCKYCSSTFCADHASPQIHQCKNYQKQYKKVYTCPLCNKLLNMNQNLSIQQNFSIHQAMDCQKDFNKNIKKVQICPGNKCKTKLTELNKYICSNCRKSVCLKHRLQQNHQCKIFG